ncbi:methyltransferase domain-containing protein [Nocardioides sp. MAH-18]|uniref:Methyltransferase domain-containing protein n=1 Tax=Nocardioides agri TaxID=2682843 RepID=A0A6L6XT92_9ACTN|nr:MULTISPECIES: class I SAM-dependent methyltransferase [unclassified Nocardioides]MBA2955751.1 class I SAM-dependent methyltransferase [Nocardioides sp. CGMCC 1.13656]MVQ50601.1 methyltransferase domain-containing protein [Nocardioides sp. MAH-18]
MESGDPAAWDAEAARFDDEADHGLHDPLVRDAWRTLLVSVLPSIPSRVADLGCGTGSLAQLVAEEGHRVDGVDFSREMVRRASAKAGSYPGTAFVVGDAADPPLSDAAYAVVLCRHVLWALPDPASALARWVRLLAPDGRLVLIEGSWSTGAGLTAARAVDLVQDAGLHPELVPLDDPAYWGGPIDDERYLVIGRSTRRA